VLRAADEDGPRCLLCGDSLSHDLGDVTWVGRDGVVCPGNGLPLAGGGVSHGPHVPCAAPGAAAGTAAQPRFTVLQGGLSG
jgi:hypothetical protein